MEYIVVERHFDEPIEPGAIEDMERRASWCLEQHRVRRLQSYLSADGRRMVCVFEAPDAESVRLSQRQAGFPFEQVWAASFVPGKSGGA